MASGRVARAMGWRNLFHVKTAEGPDDAPDIAGGGGQQMEAAHDEANGPAGVLCVNGLNDANDARVGASRHDNQALIGVDHESLFIRPIPQRASRKNVRRKFRWTGYIFEVCASGKPLRPPRWS